MTDTNKNLELFETCDNKHDVEAGNSFCPRFSSDGLITAVVVDAKTHRLLMLAHMNAQALVLTLETGIAHFWSRSRQSIWKKGETSGNVQQVMEIRTDCDQDAVELRVEQLGDGVACHTGRVSCFYRSVTRDRDGQIRLTFADQD